MTLGGSVVSGEKSVLPGSRNNTWKVLRHYSVILKTVFKFFGFLGLCMFLISFLRFFQVLTTLRNDPGVGVFSGKMPLPGNRDNTRRALGH